MGGGAIPCRDRSPPVAWDRHPPDAKGSAPALPDRGRAAGSHGKLERAADTSNNWLQLKAENISSTSAAVILLAEGRVHTSPLARRFLGMLNLDSGRWLHVKLARYWTHYDQIVKNRKSCILGLERLAAAEGGIEQVVIFGAGFDALSLEIHARQGRCRVFEIDIKNMDEKSSLMRSMDPSIADHIRCITTNMYSTDTIIPGLVEQGWRPDEPSTVIFEGISYYLPPYILWDVIGRFRTGTNTNQVIMEYLVPSEAIAKERNHIAQYPFDLIAADSGLIYITRYDVREITARVESLGGALVQHYDMMRMEKDRTSGNAIFKTRESGWIEVCRFAI